MKAYLILLFAILTVLTSCGQASPEKDYPVSVDTKNSYALGEYLFNPSAKKIWVLEKYGKGKVGTAVGYFPLKEINYDHTSLIVLGKRILFKEQFPKEVDFKSLNYIDEGLFEDKNYIYSYYPDALPIQINESSKIDISGYKRISNYIYENKVGALYFLNTINGFGLEKINDLSDLDKATLKHLQRQYFADKNGLYAFNARYFGDGSVEKIECIQLEKSNGKTIEPIVTRNYLVYHKSVYARYDLIEKLQIDADKMVECRWDDNQMIFFLTDGKNVYEQDNSAYQSMHRNTGNNYVNNFFKSGIAIQKIYNFEIMLSKDSDAQTLYFNNRKDKTGYTETGGILVKTATGFYFAVSGPVDREPIKIKKLMIYNPITDKDEVFDGQHYFKISSEMYAYKGQLFLYNTPIKELSNLQHPNFFMSNGIKTNFITDGNTLIAYGSFNGYLTENSNGTEKVVYGKWIKTGVDVSQLKAINKNLLVDENNFYDCSNGSLQVIPIKKLGLDVKLLLATEPMQYEY